jgi:hypothetical protein
MSPIVPPARGRRRAASPLRERRDGHLATAPANGPRRLRARALADDRAASSPILLAGADASRRAALRAELGGALPQSTPFAEADSVFEVLERAPASRLVVLAGDLDDTSARNLMRIVGERYPRLPVISVEANGPLAADEPA